MLLGLTDDQESFRETTARFLDEQATRDALRAARNDPAGFDPAYWRRGAELGWTSLLVGEEHGGGTISGSGLSDVRLVAYEFGRHAARDRKAPGLGKPETFQFLGFTHICGKTRASGRFKLRRITDSKRVRAKLHASRGRCGDACISPFQSRVAGSPASCKGTTTTTRCPTTSRRSAPSAKGSSSTGSHRFGDAVSATG